MGPHSPRPDFHLDDIRLLLTLLSFFLFHHLAPLLASHISDWFTRWVCPLPPQAKIGTALPHTPRQHGVSARSAGPFSSTEAWQALGPRHSWCRETMTHPPEWMEALQRGQNTVVIVYDLLSPAMMEAPQRRFVLLRDVVHEPSAGPGTW